MTHQERWATPFGAWVRRYGVRRLSQQLGIQKQAIFHWISGRSRPRPEIAQAIVSLSAGELTLDAIYSQRQAVGVAL